MSTINRDIAKTFGKAAVDNTISSTGTITTTGGGLAVSVNTTITSEDDIATADTTGLDDGQLVFFPALNKCYFYNTEVGGLAKFSESQMLAAGAHFAKNFIYFIGGYGPSYNTTVDRIPIASNANATDIGDVSSAGYYVGNYESELAGYIAGSGFGDADRIRKWVYASGSSPNPGVANVAVDKFACASSTSPTHGSTAGGFPTRNQIDNFNFSTEANASDVGDLTQTRLGVAGQESATHGYSSGGRDNPGTTRYNIIDKYAFATDGNATDVGDIGLAVSYGAGFSSDAYGFQNGGERPQRINITYKFPFASDANAVTGLNLGDTTDSKSGTGSHFSGYVGGGYGPSNRNTISKYNHTGGSESTADVGDLTQSRFGVGAVAD